jgi:phosphoribosyl 1,2-cyclic phosphodiesterase
VVETAAVRVLIDCGFSVSATTDRLTALDLSPGDLDAILITHEHGDHIGGVGALARRFGIPVWLSPGTAAAAIGTLGFMPDTRFFNTGHTFDIADLTVEPVTVPHDAREPNQFLLSCGASRLGILTDTGSITPHLEDRFQCCDALVLEFNHDQDMLLSSDYPPSVRARINSRFGHLNNEQSLEFLAGIGHVGLKQVVAAHLSERNNDTALVMDLVHRALDGMPCAASVASQHEPSRWFEL